MTTPSIANSVKATTSHDELLSAVERLVQLALLEGWTYAEMAKSADGTLGEPLVFAMKVLAIAERAEQRHVRAGQRQEQQICKQVRS